ncbi:hypothetical protein PM8797T_10244 [Gimesia maris DSM 8797]|nr:hypothetical protein PM8797T_10244 [Gimesia maris DSM 8797]HAW26606.1 hypothetical protein [Planctomycetaceae bacterium]|tara:strand:+ start:259 stop:438 length:180 start_codon:yes stop_codon:yes gene_type:complete
MNGAQKSQSVKQSRFAERISQRETGPDHVLVLLIGNAGCKEFSSKKPLEDMYSVLFEEQ